jgi:hypothetical protein
VVGLEARVVLGVLEERELLALLEQPEEQVVRAGLVQQDLQGRLALVGEPEEQGRLVQQAQREGREA